MASKSKRNKVKFKWTKELAFLLGFIVLIGGATLTMTLVKKFSGKDIKAVNEAIVEFNSSESQTVYTLDVNDNVFKIISHDGLVSRKNDSGYTYVWYGTLKSAEYLQNLNTLNTLASETYKVDTIYLYYADYVQDAAINDTQDTESYKKTLKSMEDALNNNREADATAIDLEKYAAFFVFKNGKLVYNSQVEGDSSEYNWNTKFEKAFSFEQLEKMNG